MEAINLAPASRTHIPLRPNLEVLQIGIKSQGYRELGSIWSIPSEDPYEVAGPDRLLELATTFSRVDVRSRESLEFYSRHHDAQKDRAAVRAEIKAADDFAVRHIMRTQALEAGARVDTLEDTGSSS
ncbi:hypothetical protein Tco_1052805 [Tanacetum coccineum]